MDTKTICLVTGPRSWPMTVEAMQVVRIALAKLPPGSVLIHGDAAGVDTIAKTSGMPLVYVAVPYYGPAGKAGGPIRNGWMVKIAQALWEADPSWGCVCLAFGSPGKSKGTDDCARQAARAGLPVMWVPRDAEGDAERREQFVKSGATS